ncbi:MAG: efflux RND transporter periplasmic adaptor subunit [bacterium]|nr:efflux RND transporter periplasmic adaptor subunit [bacterium]
MKKTGLIILIFFIFFYCGKRNSSNQKNTPEAEPVTVKTAIVQEMLIAEQIKITGEIAPTFQIEVFPRANGIVVSEAVSLGDAVRKDLMLAEVRQDLPGMEFANVKIEATNNGFLTSDQVDIGGRVSVQKPVYTISGLQPIYMIGKVSESYLSQIKIGAAVSVAVDAYPDESFAGKIAEIDPTVDRMSRMAALKITINNPNLKLKPGMFARCYLKIGDHSGQVVPLDAIVRTGANRYVYRIDDGKAKEIRVQTGVILNETIEVQGELKPGDRVVILGQNLLEDGASVQIEKENLDR